MINKAKEVYRHAVIRLKEDVWPDEARIILIYRYASWMMTSLFYLLGDPPSSALLKIGVIVSLLVASKIITDQYIRYKHDKAAI